MAFSPGSEVSNCVQGSSLLGRHTSSYPGVRTDFGDNVERNLGSTGNARHLGPKYLLITNNNFHLT